MKLLNCMVLFAGFLFLTSCSFVVPENSDRETVEFIFPQWPPETYKAEAPYSPETPEIYPKLSRWLVEIYSGETSERFSQTDGRLILSVKKNHALCILVTPITLDSEGNEVCFFKPAGTIYPYSYDEGKLQLTWLEGFSAYIFKTLYSSKKDSGVTTEHMIRFLESFNWYKFNQTLQKKARESETFYNPWLIDSATLMDNLSYGNFKPSYLDQKYTYTLKLAKLNLSSVENLLSSYIPENKNIWATGTITVKKQKYFTLSCNTDYAVIILYSSSKKISLEYVFMPIFIEEI